MWVVPATVIVEGDSLVSYELRYAKVLSARKTQQMLYDKYGHWDKKLSGRYQSNIPLLVWEKVIVPGLRDTLTLAAGGTETKTAYFSFVIALDENGQDCFKTVDPRSDRLIEYFNMRMNMKGKYWNFWKAVENDGN